MLADERCMRRKGFAMKPLHVVLSRRGVLTFLGTTSLEIGLARAADGLPKVVIHRDPSCGCCGAWAEHVRRAGFAVRVRASHPARQPYRDA